MALYRDEEGIVLVVVVVVDSVAWEEWEEGTTNKPKSAQYRGSGGVQVGGGKEETENAGR